MLKEKDFTKCDFNNCDYEAEYFLSVYKNANKIKTCFNHKNIFLSTNIITKIVLIKEYIDNNEIYK